MRPSLSTVIVFSLLLSAPAAYAGDLLWVRQFGGAGNENLTGLARDGNGHVYASGDFAGTVDFDPGPGTYPLTATGSRDVFLTRLDPDGNFVWAKQLGGTATTAIGSTGSVAVDPAGNIYVVGAFSGTTDFDPGPGAFPMTAVSADAFVVKLGPSGDFIWARQMGGGPGSTQALAVAADVAGVALGGQFTQTADFDPGPGTLSLTAAAREDAFVARLDGAGNLIFAVPFGSTEVDITQGLAVGAGGSVYAAGRMALSIDFDPGPGVLMLGGSIFVVRLDSTGGLTWARAMGPAQANARAFAIALDGTGSVYTAGFFTGTVDFDPGAGISNLNAGTGIATDGFVSKLDSAGDFVWAVQLGGTSDDIVSAVAVGSDSHVHAVGRFAGTADLDPGAGTFLLTSSGSNEIYVSELDGNGGFVSALGMGGTLSDVAGAVVLDPIGNPIVAGNFRDTVDFDPGAGVTNLISQGGTDAFVWKFGAPSISLSGNEPASIWFCPASETMEFDVVTGSLADLRADRDYSRATCLGDFVANPAAGGSIPAVGDGFYYLARGSACCMSDGYGHSTLNPDPRIDLANANLCP